MHSICKYLLCCLFLTSCAKNIDENGGKITPLSGCLEDLKKQSGAMSTIKELISKIDGKKQEYFAAKILAGAQAQYRDYILLMKKGGSYILITHRKSSKIHYYQLKKEEYDRLKNDLNFNQIRNFGEVKGSYISAHSYCSFFELKDRDGIKVLNIPNTHGNILEDDRETLEERIIKITQNYNNTHKKYSYEAGMWSTINEYFKSDEINDIFYELR